MNSLKILKKIILPFLLCILIFSCNNMKKPKVIGHRGAKGYYAENTLGSIKKAMDLGVDGIEIDVFKCGSGELVVFHDQMVDSLTDGKGMIELLSLDSIKKLTVLGNEKIPTLDEVLNLIDGRVMLNIELKGSNTSFLTHQLLKSYFQSSSWKPEKVFISSFNWNELKAFHQLNKEIKIAILIEKTDPSNAIKIANELNAFAINSQYTFLNKENISKIKSENLMVYAWTVNEYKDIRRMKRLGVDGIISDFPDRVK